MRTLSRLFFALLLTVWTASSGFAQEAATSDDGPKTLAGFELGISQPVDDLNDYIGKGVAFSPFLAHMFNANIGIIGQMHVLANNRLSSREGIDDRTTWVLGGTVGPRLVTRYFEPLQLWGAAQGGIFGGLSSDSPVDEASAGISAGAGFDFPLTDRVNLGAFGRYNRLFQDVASSNKDAEYVTAGMMLMYNLSYAEPAPPPPPPVVQAPPPPAPEPAPKRKIVLRGVNFDFDRAVIRPDAVPVLDAAVQTLIEEGSITIVAEGHTDSVGSEEYNLRLSVRRANAVRDHLVAGGIDPSRIRVEGLGESRPVASNDTEDGRAQNRRVELLVVGD